MDNMCPCGQPGLLGVQTLDGDCRYYCFSCFQNWQVSLLPEGSSGTNDPPDISDGDQGSRPGGNTNGEGVLQLLPDPEGHENR